MREGRAFHEDSPCLRERRTPDGDDGIERGLCRARALLGDLPGDRQPGPWQDIFLQGPQIAFSEDGGAAPYRMVYRYQGEAGPCHNDRRGDSRANLPLLPGPGDTRALYRIRG